MSWEEGTDEGAGEVDEELALAGAERDLGEADEAHAARVVVPHWDGHSWRVEEAVRRGGDGLRRRGGSRAAGGEGGGRAEGGRAGGGRSTGRGRGGRERVVVGGGREGRGELTSLVRDG